MAQYLKSLATGVVLPYVEASLKSADVRKMSAEECAEYEASMSKPVVQEAVPEPEPVFEEPAAAVEVEVEDYTPEDDPQVQEVLGALETD